MKFLKGLEIILNKIPQYDMFKETFNIKLDYNILSDMLTRTDIPEIDEDRKLLLKPVVDKIDKKTGVLEVKYSQASKLGRHYAINSISPITLSRHIKHTLFSYLGWIDIDLVKSYPTILCNLFQKNNIFLPIFKEYLERPTQIFDEIIAHYSVDPNKPLTRDDAKLCFSAMIFGGGITTWKSELIKQNIQINETVEDHPFLIDFKTECKVIITTIQSHNPKLFELLKKDDDTPYQTSNRAMSYFCGIIENDILHSIYKFLLKNKVINKSSVLLEYDGLCFKPPAGLNIENIMDKTNEHLQELYELNVKVIHKPYNSIHIHQSILDDRNKLTIKIWDVLTLSEATTYSQFKYIFEKSHFKILNKCLFAKEIHNSDNTITLHRMTKQEIQITYEHFTFIDTEDKMRQKSFINMWVLDKYLRVYTDIKCVPPPLVCENDIYNTWSPFRVEKLELTEDANQDEMEDALQIIKNYIKNLCDYDDTTTEHILLWIGQMIKYPAVKTIVPTIISDQGAGKGNFMNLMKKLLGKNKVLETRTPEVDIWGPFNSLLAEAFLINCDELSLKQQTDAEGKLKGLITNGTVSINTKGIKQYDMSSYHRFLMTTNKEFAIKSSEDDRRNLIIRSSDIRCRKTDENIKYHLDFISAINNDNNIVFFYNYLMNLDGLDMFHTKPIPQTKYQKELIKSTRPIYEQFLEKFVSDFRSKEVVEITNKIYYDRFLKWREVYGIKYECSCHILSRNTNLLMNKLPENAIISIGDHHITMKKYDIIKLREYFKIPAEFD